MTKNKVNIKRAILLSLFAYVAFSLSDGLRKLVAQDHEILDILFWQAVCGMVILLF